MIPLLAQESVDAGITLRDILQPEILVFAVPIVAIVGGCVIAVTNTLVRHRERIAMIRAGFDPDAHAAADDEV